MEMVGDKWNLFRVTLAMPGCGDFGHKGVTQDCPRDCPHELLAQTTAQTKPRFGIGNALRELWKMSKCWQERCLCCQLQEGGADVVGTA